MGYRIINEFVATPLYHRLKELRIRQFDLAKTFGISPSYLSKMLRGIVPMPKYVVDRINAILAKVRERNRKKIIKK